MKEEGSKRASHFIASLITLVSISLGVIHLVRDCATIDNIIVWLLLIAVFPWAGAFVRSFEIFGIKGELAQEKLAKIQGAAESADQKSDLAIALADPAMKDSSITDELALDRCAEEYIHTRERLKPGSERTSQMTAIFGKMTALAKTAKKLDVKRKILNHDAGQRLWVTRTFTLAQIRAC